MTPHHPTLFLLPSFHCIVPDIPRQLAGVAIFLLDRRVKRRDIVRRPSRVPRPGLFLEPKSRTAVILLDIHARQLDNVRRPSQDALRPRTPYPGSRCFQFINFLACTLEHAGTFRLRAQPLKTPLVRNKSAALSPSADASIRHADCILFTRLTMPGLSRGSTASPPESCAHVRRCFFSYANSATM